MRRNANSDIEGATARWQGRRGRRRGRRRKGVARRLLARSLARSFGSRVRPANFDDHRDFGVSCPYNRRAPNSGSEIVRALVAYGELLHFLAIFQSFATLVATPGRHISRNCDRNCISVVAMRQRRLSRAAVFASVSRLARDYAVRHNRRAEYKIIRSSRIHEVSAIAAAARDIDNDRSTEPFD